MLRTQLIILFSLLLTATSCWAVDPGKQQSASIFEYLITTLPGSWAGQAIETPIGPVDYDINFYDCKSGMVSGIAKLNVSNHHWQFHLQESDQRLIFLSTFRGNRDPVELVVSGTGANTIHFHAPRLALLSLSITLQGSEIEIRVFHHQKPHVFIVLSRVATITNSLTISDDRNLACQKL